jgi:3-oxoacyl-[acyl-carrier protein] reductase
MTGRLEGRTAIVTGGGRGIGAGIARVFAAEGARVLIATRTLKRGEEVAAAINKAGGEASAMATDVSDADQVNAMIAEARKRYGAIDIMAHNAGIFPSSTIVKMKEAEWDQVLDTNLKSLFLVCKAVLPHMTRRNHGRIVVTSSISGPRVGMPGWSHYCASKAGVNGFLKSAALEVAKKGVTINAVEPGNIQIRATGSKMAQAHEETMKQAIPMGYLGQPEDIAYAALYLASDEARYVTGQTIVVDGGQVLPESQSGIL